MMGSARCQAKPVASLGILVEGGSEPFLTAERFADNRAATLCKPTFREKDVLRLFDSSREQRGAKGAGGGTLYCQGRELCFQVLVHASGCFGSDTCENGCQQCCFGSGRWGRMLVFET